VRLNPSPSGDDDADIDALLAAESPAGAGAEDQPSLEASLDDIEEALTRAGEILSEEEAGRILAEDSGILPAETPAEDPIDRAEAFDDTPGQVESAFEQSGDDVAEIISAGGPAGQSAADAGIAPVQPLPPENAEMPATHVADDDAELQAIASAFEEAACELDGLTTQVRQMVCGPGDSVDPASGGGYLDDEPVAAEPVAAEPVAAADSALPQTSQGAGETGQTFPPGHKTVPVRPVGDAGPHSGSCSTRPLREELQAIRSGILEDLDRVVALLNTIDRTRLAAEEAYARAAAFRDAAAEGVQAVQAMADAQMEASTAREAYERAQQKLQEARRSWEQIRVRAAAAEQAAAADRNPPAGN